jgi:hypothetical protein
MILFPGSFIQAEATMGIRNSVATKRSISTGLFAFSLLLAALIFLRVVMFVGTTTETRLWARRITPQVQPTASQIQEKPVDSRALVARLKKKNLFTPPPSREHPVKDVAGILGNEAFIGGRWYRCHDKIGEATIVYIGPTEVRIEWDGKEKTFAPIQGGRPASAKGPEPAVLPEKKEKPRYAPVVIIGQPPVPPWWTRIPFQDLSSQEQEKLQKLRDRWFDMSEQEQQDATNALQKRFGG